MLFFIFNCFLHIALKLSNTSPRLKFIFVFAAKTKVRVSLNIKYILQLYIYLLLGLIVLYWTIRHCSGPCYTAGCRHCSHCVIKYCCLKCVFVVCSATVDSSSVLLERPTRGVTKGSRWECSFAFSVYTISLCAESFPKAIIVSVCPLFAKSYE